MNEGVTQGTFLKHFPFFPAQASSLAGDVDLLYLGLVAISLFFIVLICVMLISFGWRYYFKRTDVDRTMKPAHSYLWLEALWTIGPLLIALGIYAWSTVVYFKGVVPPADTMDIYVVCRQWMWKIQHPSGKREINTLHVPVGQAVRTIMTSQDVIHSFYVPAFREKQDVLPGRYTYMWFKPTRIGTYHLFCAEYCGTKHSGMIGQVIVQSPADYEAWLSGVEGQGGSMAERGQALFTQYACNTCHKADGSGRGPNLEGLFGKTVVLTGGATVRADENYLHESILTPQKKIVLGYQPVMPTFKGQLSEDQVMNLVAYIKTLGAKGNAATAATK